MEGVLLIDKPTGLVSFEVLKQVRKTLNIRKVGFLGTLDPLATGLLVFFVGNATKLIKYFDDVDKEYVVQMELGKVSDTYDRVGDVRDLGDLGDLGSLQDVIPDFLGQRWQQTPSFSAVKFQGKRAYEHAREGKEIDLGKRQVSIHEIEILKDHHPQYDLRVRCSSGTYIRSLVHEVGQKLGCGAIMNELRRTRVGKFFLENAVPIENLRPEHLIPPVEVIKEMIDWKRFSESDKRQLLKQFG